MTVTNDLVAKQRKQETKMRRNALRNTEKRLAEKEKELASYKAEIYKSLQGEGRFSADVLNELLENTQKLVQTLRAEAQTIRLEIADLEGEAKAIQKTCDEMITWGKNLQNRQTRTQKDDFAPADTAHRHQNRI